MLVLALPAAAATFTWDQGDVWSQSITATLAHQVEFFGDGCAHSHGQDVTWSVNATIDGETFVLTAGVPEPMSRAC